MNMGVAKRCPGVTLAWAAGGQAAGVVLMNSSSDEPKAEAITILLVEDDAPTLWRLQDALAKRRVPGAGRRHARGGSRLSGAGRARGCC